MPDLSQTQPFSFSCQGGLVLNQPTFNMQPGQALELENFEPDIDGGYRRIDGFKKFVNHIVPQTSSSSEEVLMVVNFANKIVAAVVFSQKATMFRVPGGPKKFPQTASSGNLAPRACWEPLGLDLGAF